MEIKTIAVLGAGLMGHGITQVAAQVAQYEVYMRDIKQEFLDNGMKMINDSLQRFVKKGEMTEAQMKEVLSRIHPTLDLKEAVSNADLIIEAVTENPELKKKVLAEADSQAKPEAIIASNTSSISISEIASATNRPEKFAGMHFFNPPQLMKLIEIIRGAKTSDETLNTIVEVTKKMGKEPVVVKKDVAGFVVNRILIPALNEAINLVNEGVATPEDIDIACRLGLGHPVGPFQLMDLVTNELTLNIQEILYQIYGPRFMPRPVLRQKVDAGHSGRKTGKGWYDYRDKK